MIALPENAIEPAVASARPGQTRCGRGTGVVVLSVASVGVVLDSGAMRQLTRRAATACSRLGNDGFAARTRKKRRGAALSRGSGRLQARRRRAAKASAAMPASISETPPGSGTAVTLTLSSSEPMLSWLSSWKLNVSEPPEATP